MQRKAALRQARRLHLDLHARHVDAGRAFAPASLAGDAKLHGLGHLVGAQRVAPELAGDGEAQRIGAPARDVALVAGHAIARAHDTTGEHATGAVVVAHLDCALKTAAGAGIGGPVKLGADVLAAIVRPVAEDAAFVELRRAHDLAGIVEALGIEPLLDLFKGAHEPLAEHLGVEFGAHDAVAVFARMRALVGPHQLERLFGDGAHRLDVVIETQVEHRAHMQAADRGMRIPGAAGAVLGEMSVSFEVYSARRDSGTAQSLFQPRPRSPIISLSCMSRRRLWYWSSSANSTNSTASGSPRTTASIVGRNIAISRAKPSMVRSMSSTAIGPSLTMCWAASIA